MSLMSSIDFGIQKANSETHSADGSTSDSKPVATEKECSPEDKKKKYYIYGIISIIVVVACIFIYKKFF